MSRKSLLDAACDAKFLLNYRISASAVNRCVANFEKCWPVPEVMSLIDTFFYLSGPAFMLHLLFRHV